ncbi:hypothetical protein K402DRAFT_396121 [Aulographum hederae CBS 113979]|uniref:Micro-fibrillar-associated protein 1 C-terminal domain-containing protein n=1 Tax=Aulographum hederae CBS 113979 TaxID=1176131 RepID=A0A6G1GSZ4_9PEZI|nr:hypothetical protein K402DRAFT_396121 [Aulographum hederae CBS 113979]
MPPKRMTANPVRPGRHFPGKPAQEAESSEEEESDEEDEATPATAPPPKVTSFAPNATKLTSNLKNVVAGARRKTAEEQEALKAEAARRQAEEDEFETESEGEAGSEKAEQPSDDESEEEEEESEEEESNSSEEDRRPKFIRPVFIRKDQRKNANGSVAQEKTADEQYEEEERRRKEKADALVQEQIEKAAAERAASKKFWDEGDLGDLETIDDTDDVDPEGEHAAWKLREFTRIKRDRDALIAAEKEREEVERRRNLTEAEREEEDRALLDAQADEKKNRGESGHLKQYFHKGAFFQEESKEMGLRDRDIMGAKFQDEVDKSILPEYLQRRNMAQIGRKGATKYKDLRQEDTGRWAEYGDNRRKRDDFGLDERFRSDFGRDGEGPSRTGANASFLGERKRPLDEERKDDKRQRTE